MSIRPAHGRTCFRQPNRHPLCIALAASLAAMACTATQPAAAQAVWEGTDSASWVNGNNWNPVGPPGPLDDVNIDTTDPNPTVLDGAATTVLQLTVGQLGDGRLTIQGGGTLDSETGIIAFYTNSSGWVGVIGPGSAWNTVQTLYVGHGGDGTLRIENGGTVTSATGSVGTGVLLGESGAASGHGEVHILGAGSEWTVAGNLVVGNLGTASITVGNQGTLTSQDATIGRHARSTGTVLVTGAGSIWDYAGTLTIGDSGNGSLAITNGGQAINASQGNGLIAAEAGSTGAVTVAGADSLWDVGGALYTGLAGSGTLHIEDGATVNSAFAGIGDTQGSEGSVTVTGGSLWTGSANFSVGGGGTGTLAIADGSVVTGASFGFIGGMGSGTGTVSLSDGSSLVLAGGLHVGQGGTGALHVDGGSTVNNTNALVGNFEGSEGSVSVSGLFSLWNNAGDLVVGNEGAGTLDITDHGTVVNSLATIGASASGVGAVTVDGPGSTWGTLGLLTVGDQGSGSLAVADEGLVTSGSGMIGRAGGAAGDVRLEGPGTHWGIGSSLTVGDEGAGALEIAGGATVLQIGGSGNVGDSASGSGEVLVTGAGSRWDTSGGLFVGRAGSGALAVLDGAQVSNVGGAAGASAGAEGTVLVSGADSLWTDSAQFAVGGSGSGSLTIADGGAVQGEVMILGASAGGVGHAVVTGADSLWQTQDNLTVGSAGSGTLIIEDGGTVATDSFSWVGSQAGSEGTVIVRGAGSAWNPDSFITLGRGGAGTLTVAGDGTVTTGGALFFAQQAGSSGTLNFGAGAGEEAAAPGTLQASSIAFGDGAATLNFNHDETDYGFSTPMTSVGGGGHAINHLAGTTILDGDSSGFSGTTTVSGGTLAVDGVLGGTLSVQGDGTLAGTGTVSTTTVAAGGTLAPGASIGTLAVDGDVTFLPGSVFGIELDLAGNSDLLAVAGTATLDGGAVATLPLDGIAIGTPYTILTAAGGVSGAFDSLLLDAPSAFLSPTLAYQPDAVLLELMQSASFASVALTPNQAAAGSGADSLGNGHPVWDAVVVLGEEDARDAFDALSGEIHASTLGALVDESRYVREAAHARLYAAGDADAPGFWARAFGGSGRIDGDGNAARLDRSAAGLFLGGDLRVGDGWWLGAVLGHHRASHDADPRRSSADVDSTHLAAYAGRHWGASALRLGVAHAWHRIDVDRQADFNGYSETLQARYDAGTLQVFGEYGYAIARGDFTWEPFAALAWVQVDGDRFDEGTGAAALSGDGGAHDATIAALGVRLAGRIDAGQASPATVRGMLGWQRGFGDTTPRVRSAFAGGDPFVVAGAPAGGAAVVEAGLGFALGASTKLEVSYAGRFGSDLRENASWRPSPRTSRSASPPGSMER